MDAPQDTPGDQALLFCLPAPLEWSPAWGRAGSRSDTPGSPVQSRFQTPALRTLRAPSFSLRGCPGHRGRLSSTLVSAP